MTSPTIVTTSNLTGQTAAIARTTLFTPGASGLFMIKGYMVIGASGTGSALCVDFFWTDSQHAQGGMLAGIGGGSLRPNEYASFEQTVYCDTAGVDFEVTFNGVGCPTYDLFLSVISLS